MLFRNIATVTAKPDPEGKVYVFAFIVHQLPINILYLPFARLIDLLSVNIILSNWLPFAQLKGDENMPYSRQGTGRRLMVPYGVEWGSRTLEKSTP
jgi:hypothetical protein